MRRLVSLIILLTAILLDGSAKTAPVQRDSLIVSLVTCWPGAEVYELCGHSALRIRTADGKSDTAFNYGLFDFNQPNFVYRFVKGDTDYMVGGYPFDLFLTEYQNSGRRVMEQELNLTQSEAHRLRHMLEVETLPQNRVYRYNYVRNNCATRITQRLLEATGEYIVFPDTIGYGTLRDEMRAFHRAYPWYQFGIDLALGSGLDYPVRPNEEMFVPVVMYQRYAGAHFPDGRQLVRSTRELVPDSGHATLAPTRWYASPLFVAAVLFLLSILACVLMARRRKIWRWLYSIWFGILGIAGCVIAFLVFASSHEATSPNLLIVWLNPLQLLVAAFVWSRRTRWMATGVIWYNLIVLVILMIVWPWQGQSANPAFFPLMGVTGALALTYAILAAKNSYNKDSVNNKTSKHEQTGRRVAGRTGGTVNHRRARVGGQAPARGGNRR